MGEGAVLAANDTEDGEGRVLSTCAVAPHQVYGPSDRLFLPAMLKTAKSGVLRVMGTGENLVSFTHERNIAYGLILAAGAMASRAAWLVANKPEDDVAGRCVCVCVCLLFCFVVLCRIVSCCVALRCVALRSMLCDTIRYVAMRCMRREQASKQASKQANKQTNKQANKQTKT